MRVYFREDKKNVSKRFGGHFRIAETRGIQRNCHYRLEASIQSKQFAVKKRKFRLSIIIAITVNSKTEYPNWHKLPRDIQDGGKKLIKKSMLRVIEAVEKNPVGLDIPGDTSQYTFTIDCSLTLDEEMFYEEAARKRAEKLNKTLTQVEEAPKKKARL